MKKIVTAPPAPLAVKKALLHVREHFPDVCLVVFNGEGRWQYMNDVFESKPFGDSIDREILEAAADAVADEVGFPACYWVIESESTNASSDTKREVAVFLSLTTDITQADVDAGPDRTREAVSEAVVAYLRNEDPETVVDAALDDFVVGEELDLGVNGWLALAKSKGLL